MGRVISGSSGARSELPPARPCAREAVAASGCDMLHDGPQGQRATYQMLGSWSQEYGDTAAISLGLSAQPFEAAVLEV
jgi:hypothetical protein